MVVVEDDAVWGGEYDEDEEGEYGGGFPPFPLESFFSSFLAFELPFPCGGYNSSVPLFIEDINHLNQSIESFLELFLF